MSALRDRIGELYERHGTVKRFDIFAAKELGCTPSYVRGALSRIRAPDDATYELRTGGSPELREAKIAAWIAYNRALRLSCSREEARKKSRQTYAFKTRQLAKQGSS